MRFRLGGMHFPPTIYYKIFTNAPVCDVGSFAPKDYTTSKQINPGTLHNQEQLPPPPSPPKKKRDRSPSLMSVLSMNSHSSLLPSEAPSSSAARQAHSIRVGSRYFAAKLSEMTRQELKQTGKQGVSLVVASSATS